QRQEFSERAAIAVDALACACADARALRRVPNEGRDARGELLGTVHDLGRALGDQQPRDLLAVEVVRSRQDRHSERGRLEQVVAADRYEAAADEGHVGGGVEVEQLTE